LYEAYKYDGMTKFGKTGTYWMGLGRYALTVLLYNAAYYGSQMFYALFLGYGIFNQNVGLYMFFDIFPVVFAGWLWYSYFDAMFNTIKLYSNDHGGIYQMTNPKLSDNLSVKVLNLY